MTEQEERELNKRIAKALGYTFEENGELCTVTAPDGTWQRTYHPDQYTSVPGLGNWARDTDAALALLKGDELYTTINAPNGRSFDVRLMTWPKREYFQVIDESLSVAICRAWLAWKEGQAK